MPPNSALSAQADTFSCRAGAGAAFDSYSQNTPGMLLGAGARWAPHPNLGVGARLLGFLGSAESGGGGSYYRISGGLTGIVGTVGLDVFYSAPAARYFISAGLEGQGVM